MKKNHFLRLIVQIGHIISDNIVVAFEFIHSIKEKNGKDG